ncbi:MAG: DEAD/DEAH box helicase family protein [Lysobacteraceae bacterium]
MSIDAFGFGLTTRMALLRAIERHAGIESVWIFGSRARGDFRPESDIDLAVDAPDWTRDDFARFLAELEGVETLYAIDCVWFQSVPDGLFRSRIERDRRVFWQRQRRAVDVETIGGVALKKFQTTVLRTFDRYLAELARFRSSMDAKAKALKVLEDQPDVLRQVKDFPKQAWDALRTQGALPKAYAAAAHSSRFDGAGDAVPNVCFKIPTGGGKTLLAAASVARVFSLYLKRQTGLVLWVVPNEAIYRQTLKALSDRDHPYRQILNVAAAGRVKILEKTSPLTRLDTDSHLCVMVLMLASAARVSKETLRLFRDRGSVLGFLPREDDVEAHWALLQKVPNLDVYAPVGQSQEAARRQKGSIVKSSLGNVMRLLRPMIVMDEGHHAYTENALSTLDGFNPSLLLELSATPRVASAKGGGSNILVDVRGTDLDDAQMIKLPIHVEAKRWTDWQSCVAASLAKLDELQAAAERLQGETARYVRPILLVQVERTGKDQRDAGYIHADDAQAYLLQLGLQPRHIAVKTSEKDDLKSPENLDLLSPLNEVRVIITKQALQEGWDCPFAYVLCSLAASRNAAAMTQLVGRILRQPAATKTGCAPLDSCYVYCHDAQTGEIVERIRKALEGEGMGDLTAKVKGDDPDAEARERLVMRRRPAFAGLRLFLPRVTWNEGTHRRELVYESDVLTGLDWNRLDPHRLAQSWAPSSSATASEHVVVDLGVLRGAGVSAVAPDGGQAPGLARARIVRALIDLAPNPWLVWRWVGVVVDRLISGGFSEDDIGASSASLIEALRVDIEAQRDELAQANFDALVAEGRIGFSLRADATDYELPFEQAIDAPGALVSLQRPDRRPVEKSLLEPALRLSDINDFEAEFAGYLDSRSALEWWHRNVAKTQYGLQGWRRNKVYPDFVFGSAWENGDKRLVLLETKGAYLAGSVDTAYKKALLERLSEMFSDGRVSPAGELSLEGINGTTVECDLLIDQAWQGVLEFRYFRGSGSRRPERPTG